MTFAAYVLSYLANHSGSQWGDTRLREFRSVGAANLYTPLMAAESLIRGTRVHPFVNEVWTLDE